MTKARCQTVCVTLVAGALGGFLIGWAIPVVVDWFPMSSPIRGGIDACFVGIEKLAYRTVKLLDSGASPDNSIVYVWVCFALMGALVALTGLLVLHLLRSRDPRLSGSAPPP
jgi:hypothetical protein